VPDHDHDRAHDAHGDAHGLDRAHGHHHHPEGSGGAVKDPAEQEALARDLAGELADVFARYVTGGIDFAELSFATYDVLQDLHVVATGAYELVADDTSDDSSDDEGDGDDGGGDDEGEDEDGSAGDGDEDGGIDDAYDEETATEQQEDLSGEPAR
jgi:hypothetical protein